MNRPVSLQRLRYQRNGLAAVGSLVLVVSIDVALAQTPAQSDAEHWAQCRGFNQALIVPACTVIIESGKEAPPGLAFAYDNRARGKSLAGDLAGALSDLNTAIEVMPSNPSLYMDRGALFARQHQRGAALTDFNRAIELSHMAAAYVYRSLIRSELGNHVAAVADLDEAIRVDPSYQPAYRQRGLERRLAKDLRGSLDDLNRAIELIPTDAYAFALRSKSKDALNDKAGGLEDAKRSLEFSANPHTESAFMDRIEMEQRIGDEAAALRDCDLFVAAGLAPASAYGIRALIKRDMQDLDGAIEDFTAAIRVDGQRADLYRGRSTTLARKKDFASAVRDCYRALELAPSSVGSALTCADWERDAGNTDGAIRAYGKVIDMAPSDPRPYYNRGLMEANQHDFAAARRDFTRAVALPPINDYAYLRLWLVRARLGDRTAATTDLAAVIPVRVAAHANEWTLSVARFLAGQITETDLFARTPASDADTTKGNECEAYFYAGWVRLLDGDREKAKEHFQRSLATGKDTFNEFTSAQAEFKALGGTN